MLSKLGYGLAALVVVALAMACLAWTLLEPPALPVPPRGVVVIKDVTLVNPGLGRAAHVDITVRSGVITAISPTTAATSRYDLRCGGCYALPGLIDMNARMRAPKTFGLDRAVDLMMLRYGVTTVRDTGAVNAGIYTERDAIAAGRWPGPRVISCGPLLNGPLLRSRDGVIVRTAEAARQAVTAAAAAGVRCVSITWTLSPEVTRAIASEAARARLPVVAHVPHGVSILDAPYIADVQGLSGVTLPTDFDALPTDNGDSYWNDYACRDFDRLTEERLAAVVAAAVKQHTAHTPLLTLGYVGNPNERPEVCRDIATRRGQVVKALFRAGVPVYAGSGGPPGAAPPGEALENEIRRFASLGLTPDQALATATTSPGRFWPDTTYGQIAIGLPADIVLYRRDPSLALPNLSSRYAVISDGRIYFSIDLDAWVMRYRRHFASWQVRTSLGDPRRWFEADENRRWMGGSPELVAPIAERGPSSHRQ